MSKQYGFQKKCDKCGYFMLFSRCFNCESADYFQKTDKKLSEKKKMPKWGYIGIVLFIMLIVGYNVKSSDISISGYDWCYPSCDDDVQSSIKFNSDGTFASSSIMFGGMSRWGNWKSLGKNEVRLVTTRISTNSSGDKIPPPQVITILSSDKIKIGSTVYIKG